MLDSRSAYVVNPSLLMNLSAGSPSGKQQMRELLEEYDSILQGRIDSLKGLSQSETTLRSHIAFENDVYVKEKGIKDPTTALSATPKDNGRKGSNEDDSDHSESDDGKGKLVRPARAMSGSSLKDPTRRSGSDSAGGNFNDVSAQVRRMFRAVRLFERKRKLDRLSNLERTHNVSFSAAQSVGSLNALLEQFDRSSAVGSAFGSASAFDSSILSPSDGGSNPYELESGGVMLPYEQWTDQQIKEHLLTKLQVEESRNTTLRAELREHLSKLSSKQANADRAAKVDPIESIERGHFDRLWTLSERLKDLALRFQGTSGVSAGYAMNSLTVQMNEILQREEERRIAERDRRRQEWRTDGAAASVIGSAGDSSSRGNSFAGRSSSFLSRQSPTTEDGRLHKRKVGAATRDVKPVHDRTQSGGSDRDTTTFVHTNSPLLNPHALAPGAGDARVMMPPALTPTSTRGDFALPSGASSLRPDPSLSSGPSGTNFSFSASVTQRGSFNTSLLLQPGSPFLAPPQGDFQSQASGTFRLQNQSSLGTLTASFGAPTVSSIGKYTPGLVFTASTTAPMAAERVQAQEGGLLNQHGGQASVSRSPSREGAGSSSSDTPRGERGSAEATGLSRSKRIVGGTPTMNLGAASNRNDPINTTSSSSGKEGRATGHSSSSTNSVNEYKRSELNRHHRDPEGTRRPIHSRAASDDNIHHRIDEDMRRDADRMAMEVCGSQITAEWRKASQLRHQLVLMNTQMRSLELQMTLRIPDHLNARRTEILRLEGTSGTGNSGNLNYSSSKTSKKSSFASPKRLQWAGKHSFAASISDVVHCVSMVTELTDEQVQIKALQRQCRRRVRLLEGLLELRRTAELARAVNVKLPLHL